MPNATQHRYVASGAGWHLGLHLTSVTYGALIGLLFATVACGGSGAEDDDNGSEVNTTTTATSGGNGGEAGQANAGGFGGAGGTPQPDGSWDNPFLINALPTIVEGTTIGAPSDEADSYFPCALDTNMGGGEVVYRLNVMEEGWLSAQLDDVPGDEVDVDIHLLAAASANGCITRNDSWLGAPVTPGEYWLVVDSWVNGSDEAMPGVYTLEVTLTVDGNIACLQSPIACDGMLPPYVNLDFAEQPGDVGCLPGMARVDNFCIDRYEAIVVKQDANDGWVPFSPYDHPSGGDVFLALSISDAVPQGHISQIQAADACLMAGKRLCSDNEWLRACQGAATTTYPYGNALEPGRCNDERICHPVPQYFESAENWVWSELGHPCIGQLPQGLATTGNYGDCRGAENVFDMMGNLHEWTSDPAGTFRGGFYLDTVLNGSGCYYATTAHDVSHHDYSTGFRCCGDAG